MNVQSYRALSDGIAAWGAGEARTKEDKLRKEMLKRQVEQDKLAEDERQFNRTMRTKQIEMAERGEKRETSKLLDEQTRGAMDDVLKQIEATRRGQETAARVDLLKAQSAAVAAKPPSPVAAQLAGVEDFSNNFAAALQENQDAMAEAAKLGTTTPRVLKAQIRLSALQQLSESWKKNAEKEPTVDLEFPGEDGVSKMKMKVPQSQWNQNHPMWSKFATGGSPSTSTPTGAAPAAPALSAQDQQALQWAKANPNDPRAAAIIKKLTGK